MIQILLNDPQAPKGSPYLIANIQLPLSELHGKGPLAEAMESLAIVGCSIWRDQRRPGYVNVKLPSTTSRAGGNFDFLRGASTDNLEAGYAIQRFNAFLLALFVAALPEHPDTPLVEATLAEHPGLMRGGPLPDLSKLKVAVSRYGQPVRTTNPPAVAATTVTPTPAAPKARAKGAQASTPVSPAVAAAPATAAPAAANGPDVVVTPVPAPKANRGAQAASRKKTTAPAAAVATPASKKTTPAKRAAKHSEKLSSKPSAADPLAGLSLDQLKEAVWQFEQEKQHGKGTA